MIRIVFLFLLLVNYANVYAQQDENSWVSVNDQVILSSMGLGVSVPTGFISEPGFECFDDNPKLKEILTCLNNKLISKNGESVIFIPVHRILNKEDSIFIKRFSRTDSSFELNQIHYRKLKNQIIGLTDHDKGNWERKLIYLKESEAKGKFNADSVMYFQAKLGNDAIYNGKFTNIISVIIQKKDKGFLNIIIFRSDALDSTVNDLIVSLSDDIYYND